MVKVQAQVALGSDDAADRAHALRQVVAGTDRATHLVEQLLRMARLDPLAQLPDPRPVDLTEVARRVVASMYESRPEATGRIRLETSDEALTVDANPELLAAALRNLLDNALRYTPADSPVDVRAGRENKASGSALVLAVDDRDEGVPADQIGHLTERFYRGAERRGDAGHASAADTAGSGLGLAIVRRIAELHGARLEIANRRGGGLEARLRWQDDSPTTLPKNAPSYSSEPAPPSPSS